MVTNHCTSRAIRVLTTPPEDKEKSVPDPEVHKAN